VNSRTREACHTVEPSFMFRFSSPLQCMVGSVRTMSLVTCSLKLSPVPVPLDFAASCCKKNMIFHARVPLAPLKPTYPSASTLPPPLPPSAPSRPAFPLRRRTYCVLPNFPLDRELPSHPSIPPPPYNVQFSRPWVTPHPSRWASPLR